MGKENLSVAQISALNAYRQSVAKIDGNRQKIYQLEKQLQALLPAANKSELSHIQANIDRLKAKNERMLSALHKAEDTASLRDLINRTRSQLQKEVNLDADMNPDAKNQTNVLDSSKKYGTMGATKSTVYDALTAELNSYGVSDSFIQKLASLYVPQSGTTLQKAAKALATAFRRGSVNAVDGRSTTDTAILPDAVWNAAFKLGKDFGYGYSANNAAAKVRKAAKKNGSNASDISLSEKKAKTVRENYANGQQFEGECVEIFGQNVTIKAQQVSIQTSAGTIRADFVTIDDNGVLHIYEFKSSQTAQLTQNQKAVFAEIYSAGGTMVGKNASVFGENVQIPEGTIVEIVRGRR